MTLPGSQNSTHSSHARDAFRLEAEALNRFAAEIPADFEDAVEQILASRGRVIVSGIGKSGHVGRKIAATLASTGTPAMFVHPSEASHGDLGMITEHDICVLISASGESSELGDIIGYAQRFSISLIGISRGADSTLMRAADFKLVLPDSPEVCAVGLAPTTSAILSMALGDALAVALMHARSFRTEDFNVFHPGGNLGARLNYVDRLMHGVDAIPFVTADTPMTETLIKMTSGGFGVAVVLAEDGTLGGIVTDGDLRRNILGLMDGTAGSFASNTPVTVHPKTLAEKALAIMNDAKITTIVVANDAHKPVGILHIHDLLRAGII